MAKASEKNQTAAPQNRLYRSEKDRVIAGVCGGLGDYFKIDPTIFRILFVLITIFGGSGVLLYIILWIVIPSESKVKQISEDTVKENVEEIKNKAQEFADEIKKGNVRRDNSLWFGILILLIGVIVLAGNFNFFHIFDIGKFWPLILILLGAVILFRR